ncbi:MAG: class I SAM-dependent methyltransferase [Pseudomonadota bacterium]
MRYKILQAVRETGLLGVWDNVSLMRHRLSSARTNREFLAANPGFVAPPVDLTFDAYNTVDLVSYSSVGRRHAEGFAKLVKDHLGPTGEGPLRLLEWGCGPGRLIRHMPDLFADEGFDIYGTDYNSRTIDWCKEALPDIHFALNELNPPLPFDQDFFDATFNYSVFTHLSEEVQLNWARELHRVLKPGGIMILTTHGRNFEYLMADPREQERYKNGEVIVQSKYEEGKKWFFAVHPDEFVKDKLLKDFVGVQKLDGEPWDIAQDVWLARKQS